MTGLRSWRMSKDLTYLEAIREALVEEMRRDPKVFVLGEDVGAVRRRVRRHAGPLRRVRRDARASTRRSPNRRSSASASARRCAATGRSPRCSSPISSRCGFDQIVNQAATLRYRYGGRASVPIVVRAPSGGNVGGGLYHSQNPEAWFIHRPGLKVVAPSTPYDAKGLLKAAIRDDNPGRLLRAQVSLPPREGPGARRRRDCADRRGGDRAARAATRRS